MDYKKSMIILVLAIFLFSMVSVSASEIDTPVASENTGQLELSANDEVIEYNLQTGQEKLGLSLYDNNESLSVQTDTNVLGADSATYSDLAGEINESGNIKLTHKNYAYDDGATPITIGEANKVIDGNGAVIDMKGSTIRAFTVSGSDVTIKNLTIKNANYNDNGGAIYFSNTGTVTDCNFVNNTAKKGGAVYFDREGTVTGCNFADNKVAGTNSGGGAVYMGSGTVTDCNFTDNKVTGTNSGGGAVYMGSGTVTGCNFVNNSRPSEGGAVYFDREGTVTDCNFVNNSASKGGAVNINSGTLTGCNFTDNSDSIYGGAVYFYNRGTVTGCNFADNSASIYGGAIRFDDRGTVTNCNFTDNSASDEGSAVYFNNGATGEIINCNFIGNSADYAGGAVYFYAEGTVTDCNFTDNSASNKGGAVHLGYGTVTNCIFADNSASKGGAINFYYGGTAIKKSLNFKKYGDSEAIFDAQKSSRIWTVTASSINITGLTFKNGKTDYGGAIYFKNAISNSNINASFINNTATSYGGANYFRDNVLGSNVSVLKAESEITMYTRNITDRDADAIIATIILPGSATGNVSVTIGDNTTVYDIDSSDHTSRGGKTFMFIRNNGLNAGQYNISATYEGDENYNPSGENCTFVVSKTKEDLNVSLYADPITIGQDAVVEMTGLANATGNITLTVNGREYQFPIVDSEMGFGIPDLFENTTAVFTYPGDENYNNFTESVDIIVNRIDSNISFHLNDIFEGEESTTYLRLPSFITGNITVILNGNARTFDIADAYVFPMDGYLFVLVTYENLTVGNYNFTAIYHGDEYFAPSNGSGKFVVFPKENVTMNISASPVIEDENVTIEIEFPDDAISATVTAVVDGKNFTAQVIDPNIKINLPALPAGNYTIPVIYSGNYKYYPLIEEVNVTVVSKPCIINAPDVTKYFDGPERFVVTVTDYRGNPLANKTVAVDINGVSYVRNTGVNGTASFPLGINSGIYNVTSAVDNQSVNSVVTVLPTINATDLVKVFRNATQFYATFLDSQGNYLAKGTVITFNINGVFYNRTVDENGLAKLNINLNQGKYIITSINTVTGENTANNVTVIPRIIENSDITKYYRNATQYTVKLIGDDGKAVGAGEIVTFNINGVLYNRTTNESGIAKLNINLQPGDYIITAEYKGCMVANNIKVLPILNATDISMKYRDGTQFKATLVDGQGKPYAGQSVTFNINGVFYNRVTDSSGMAKLNINLMPGEYIITSSYNGTAIANKITIKS